MPSLLDNSERAKQARLMFVAQLIATGLFIVTSLVVLFYYQRTPEYEYDSESLSYEEAFHGMSTLILNVTNIVGIVYFLRWFRRAYANLERVGETISYSDGWAVGAWFVPLLNLWRPYQIMKEIWYKTRRAYGTVVGNDHQLVKSWWMVLILHVFFDRLSTRVSWRANTPTELEYAVQVSLISSVLDVVALLVTIHFIRKVAEQEEGLAEAVQLHTVGQPMEPPTNREEGTTY